MELFGGDLIGRALALRKDAIFYELSRALAATYPDRILLETEDASFDPFTYAYAGECSVAPKSGVHNQLEVSHDPSGNSLRHGSTQAWYQIRWQGVDFELVTVGVMADFCRKERHFLLAPSKEVGEAFILACCEWNAEIRGEVLVFTGGWYKDADLFQSIQNTLLETLVLEGSLKQQITSDFKTFFESRELYHRYGIPWKRGVLLLGPPGNGKTHAIKGLVNFLGIPCLYVRTFEARHYTDQEMIRTVFQRARESAPCLLVFEDLDSLLNDDNRSFFLNEMDGFALNEGIMTIATTNHPERLDPAILDRPSRFDRKYTFHLPDRDCRIAYLALQNAGLEAALRLTDEEIETIAELTNDFSYAYLKELILSSMMAWIHGAEEATMVSVMSAQLEALRSQMATPAPIGPVNGEENGGEMLTRYQARWRRK